MNPDGILIDGYSLVYRSHFAHAKNPLATAAGFPTSAIFGFATMLLRILKERTPARALVAFDAGRDTFRRERFAAYKAQRAETPHDLKAQFPPIYELIDALGIRRAFCPGFEADDIIGTLTTRLEADGAGATIYSGDRDLFQLASERSRILYLGQGLAKAEEITPATLLAKTGLRPEQIPDYKALVGDASDNIPGVPGIGEKTARHLLETYGTLDGVYGHLDELTGRAKADLFRDKRDQAFLARDLARIRRDAPVDVALADLAWHGLDRARVERLFGEHEMPSLIRRLDGLPEIAAPRPTGNQQLSLF